MTPDDIDDAVVRYGMELFQAQRKEQLDTWARLDTKAQGVVTSAGIFLAAVFAVMRPGNVGGIALTLATEIGLVVAALITLVTSVGWAVYSMLIRQLAAPPLGLEVSNDLRNLLLMNTEDKSPEAIPRLRRRHLETWRSATQELQNTLRTKGKAVRNGQVLLTLGLGLATIASIYIAWR